MGSKVFVYSMKKLNVFIANKKLNVFMVTKLSQTPRKQNFH